ncbi:hypothetical protein C8R31_101648 [Nitrosospira sp. Nsp2]|uniref:hypothetical protein n=1 Tax=Nitrosospira sp. Nsp2 TaxID=136548 RepID=UPI000D3111A6|nr:hypothetical protein [Nitrosospira sp. Nsp2]PTR17484.1 hypothetical protein C8R31_101648 [Nitrosospira sp. Nsp2]
MEDSHALPASYYRDPAETLERLQLDRLGCKLCTKHERILGRSICTEQRNDKQAGVPHIGHRCKWYQERR